MTITFKKRNYINNEGLSLIYMHVCSKTRRERVALDVYVNPANWNKQDSRVYEHSQEDKDINLILDNIYSKITKIRTAYRLSTRALTVDSFLEEFNNEMPRGNFISFFLRVLNDRKGKINYSTYTKEMAVYRKMKAYKEEILFCDINAYFFVEYRNHLARLGNNKTTRNGNIKIIKKYLRYAVKAGIQLPVDLDDIEVGPTTGNRTYLNGQEVKMCYDFCHSPYINSTDKLIMAYFLFSCFTGLRISDILATEREHLKYGSYSFTHIKTGKKQVLNLNKKAKELLKKHKDLFIKKYSKKHIGETIKSIFLHLDINKKVTFHVARHSFATNYICLGGNVVKLQHLLNHSDIKDTMVYVHLAEQEQNTEADLLDGLF